MDYKLKNNADDQPNYYLYFTEELNLRLLLSGLVGKDLRKTNPVFGSDPTPASNFIIETYVDTNGNKYVQAFYNDVQVQLGGCLQMNCLVKDFVAYLEKVAVIPDVKTECQKAA